MTMDRSRLLAGGVVLATLFLAGAGRPPAARERRGGPPDAGLGVTGRLLHELALTTERRQEIRDVAQRHKDGELGDLARAFHDARRALALLIWDPKSTEAELREAGERVADRTAALEQERRALALEILALLDADQQADLRKLLEEPPEPPAGDFHPRR